jgi:hypothetical protein
LIDKENGGEIEAMWDIKSEVDDPIISNITNNGILETWFDDLTN